MRFSTCNPTKTIAGLAGLSVAFLSVNSWAADFKFATQTLTVPDGYTIELVAGPPLINRPIMGDFDDEGHFYVADASGTTAPVKKQAEEKPHRILRLTDTKGDGHFDQATVFADKLMFPEGVLWSDGAVYCSGVPSIWKLEDTDGDGVADKRTEWYDGKTMTGCANDLHGPYLGPDGYIYWCKGAFAEQTHSVVGDRTIKDSAAHIFRSRADGSEFDSIMSGGMDNPVEVVFTRGGEMIFTTTFYTNPDGGKRDGLVHAIYGGVYPKVHGVIDGLKRTGDLMPAMTHLGPAAPCGLLRYESGVLGSDFRNNLFSTQFNLHRVQRHVLEAVGGTFRTKDIDFVTSDNPDFHPTDVLEDADGSLLIIDTGGWYKVCCPTSQIAKPDILGAIYRVRRANAPRIADARGNKIDWNASPEKLAQWLDDPRPAVQKRAMAKLAKGGEASQPALAQLLKNGATATARLNSVWTLARIHSASATAAIRAGLVDADTDVQQAAAFCAGLLHDKEAIPGLIEILKNGDAHLKTTTATSLGQLRANAALSLLLNSTPGPDDRILEHALIYAAIEIADPTATAAGLASSNPAVHRAAMIALDQMDNGGLAAKDILPALRSSDRLLEQTALWIALHHPDWGSDLTGYFTERILHPAADAASESALEGQISELASSDAIQTMVGQLLDDPTTPVAARVVLLRTMKSAPLGEMPEAWTAPVLHSLAGTGDDIAQNAVAVARSLSFPKAHAEEFAHALTRLGESADRPGTLRLEALLARPGGSRPISSELFDFLCAQMGASHASFDRANAADILGHAKLTDAQLETLTTSLKSAGPFELSKLLGAYAAGGGEKLGLDLAAALGEAKGKTALRKETLAPIFEKFTGATHEQGLALIDSLNTSAAVQKKRLDELEAAITGGDRNRGQMIFSGTKAACLTCHEVGYVGGHVGPDLTKIGSIRTIRDLLEAVVYPSASFARGYEPMTVTTRSGDEFSGIVRDDSADTVLVVSGPTAEQRLARHDITEMRPGTVSVMPEGFDQQLSPHELADLITFLKSLR